jgi:hypothetical protein
VLSVGDETVVFFSLPLLVFEEKQKVLRRKDGGGIARYTDDDVD